MTGGHCVPSDHCQSRREEAQRQDEFKVMIANLKGNNK